MNTPGRHLKAIREAPLWTDGTVEGAGVFGVEDPTMFEVIAQVPDGDRADAASADNRADAASAVNRADDALAAWWGTPPRVRAEVLARAYGLMLEDRRRLSDLITGENGTRIAKCSMQLSSFGGSRRTPFEGTGAMVPQQADKLGPSSRICPWAWRRLGDRETLPPPWQLGKSPLLWLLNALWFSSLLMKRPLRLLRLLSYWPTLVSRRGVNVVPSTRAAEVVGAWLDDARVRKISFTGQPKSRDAYYVMLLTEL